MNPSPSARIPFKPMLLASALSLMLAACGGGGDSNGIGFFPPAGNAPPATQQPATQPEPDQLVSQAEFKPYPGTKDGSSDASTAFALPDNFMIVADDEANVLRIYPRAGGAAVKEWSYELEGPKLGKELDLEAGTRIGDTLYLTGSNSNKKDGSDAPDRSHLFAVKVSGTGAATTFSYVGQFSSLEAQLIAWDATNAHGLGANHFGFTVSAGAGIVPERVDGFSVEGMTSAPGDSALWLGFRAPQTRRLDARQGADRAGAELRCAGGRHGHAGRVRRAHRAGARRPRHPLDRQGHRWQLPDRRRSGRRRQPGRGPQLRALLVERQPGHRTGRAVERPRQAAQGHGRQLRIDRRSARTREGRHASATAAGQRRHGVAGADRRPRRTCPRPTRSSTATSCAWASPGWTPPARCCAAASPKAADGSFGARESR
jgi:predicted small lipoprotein YifL